MNRIVMHSLPFNAVFPSGVSHAKHILARDRARAEKLLKGFSPHGPISARKTRHHHHHHHGHGGGQTGVGGAAATSGGDPSSTNPQSIDVTDAGECICWLAKSCP
jgi:hypothetical protein